MTESNRKLDSNYFQGFIFQVGCYFFLIDFFLIAWF